MRYSAEDTKAIRECKVKFYHLSYIPRYRRKQKLLTHLTPKVPNKAVYENTVTKRICCAPSIGNCLTALQASKDEVYEVYELDLTDKFNIYKPSIKDVFDVKDTNERWIMSKCPVKYCGLIKVSKETECHSAKCYIKPYSYNVHKYKYEWIEWEQRKSIL